MRAGCDAGVWEGVGEVDMFERVRKAVPGRTGEFVLWWSCLRQFPEENETAKV